MYACVHRYMSSSFLRVSLILSARSCAGEHHANGLQAGRTFQNRTSTARSLRPLASALTLAASPSKYATAAS